MDTKSEESAITQRALELCQAIVEQPDFSALKEKFDAFMRNELLKFEYQQVNGLGEMLQMKHSQGIELEPDEVMRFEALREKLMSDPVTQGFMEAQEQMQQLHEVVQRFLNRTFELGRRPEYVDVHDGSCSDCGSH